MKIFILWFFLFIAVMSVTSIAAQWNTNGNIVSLNTNANIVGVGTSFPAAKLEVQAVDVLLGKFTNTAAATADQTALIDVQNGGGIKWRYGVGGANNGLGINAGQFYVERSGLGAVLTIPINGNVGIGTSSPVGKLQVNANNNALLARFTNSSPATSDRTALIDLLSGDNVLWRYGVGGSNNGLGLNTGQFYIERSGIGSTFTILPTGNIGVGTNTPTAKFEVRGTSGFSVGKFSNAAATGDGTALIDIQNNGGTVWRYGVGGVNNGLGLSNGEFYIERSGIGSVLAINTAGNVGIGVKAPTQKLQVAGNIVPDVSCTRTLGTSKLRWNRIFLCHNPNVFTTAKKDVQDLSYGVKEVMRLRPISFTDEGRKIGLIAEEVQKVLPEVVAVPEMSTDKTTSQAIDPAAPLGLDYMALVPLLVKGMQEQQAAIEDKDRQLNDLKTQLDQLKTMLVDKGLISSAEIPNGSLSRANLTVAPNPATLITTIHYFVPESAKSATLQVLGLNGSVLKTYSGLQKGNGQLTIDGTSFAAGTYVSTLVIDGRMRISKEIIFTRK